MQKQTNWNEKAIDRGVYFFRNRDSDICLPAKHIVQVLRMALQPRRPGANLPSRSILQKSPSIGGSAPMIGLESVGSNSFHRDRLAISKCRHGSSASQSLSLQDR